MCLPIYVIIILHIHFYLLNPFFYSNFRKYCNGKNKQDTTDDPRNDINYILDYQKLTTKCWTKMDSTIQGI